MPEEKVFHPEYVPDQPFPNEGGGEIVKEQSLPSGTYSPTTTPAKEITRKRVAVELLSQALNTRTKRILQEFELELSGGFKIGDFKDGETGDVRITPNGITARDKAGVTTMSLDGTTGDAIFKGKIQSGSVVTGSVVVGNNQVIIDGANKRIVVNDGSDDRVLIGYQSGGF